jgi:hypothetical protein
MHSLALRRSVALGVIVKRDPHCERVVDNPDVSRISEFLPG